MAELSSLWGSEGQPGDYGRVCVMIEVTGSRRPLLLSGSNTRHRSAATDVLCGGSYSWGKGDQSTTNFYIFKGKETDRRSRRKYRRTYIHAQQHKWKDGLMHRLSVIVVTVAASPRTETHSIKIGSVQFYSNHISHR